MKTKRMWIVAAGGVFLLSLAASALPLGRGKYESPNYKVVVSDGAFEIRNYDAVTVVSAPMRSGDERRNSAFMKLFGYISGKNENGQKIAMTTPVFSSTGEDESGMSFVVPQEVAKSGAPAANDKAVKVSVRKGGQFAVYRYSGRWSDEKALAAEKKLIEWAAAQQLQTTGKVEVANYDPPYTPPLLRRNEVLVRVLK